MDSSWPPRLGVGDRVRFEGRAWVVSGLAAGRVQLADALGDLKWFPVSQLAPDRDFEVLERGPRSSSVRVLPATGEMLELAQWWERHILEVINGLPPGAGSDAVPRSEYDPSVRSLDEREAAKAAELAAEGVSGASARTIRRRRQRYQAQGVQGLIDGRAIRKRAPGARQDPRVLELLLTLVSDDANHGRIMSAENYRQDTGRMLELLHGAGAVALPSRSTFQRLVKELVSQYGRADGIHVADADGIRLSRPGERVYVDTVSLALPVHLAHRARQPVLMTVAVDELTWTICTVMVHSSRRPLDGPLILARLCDPPALRDPQPDVSGAEGEAMPLILPESLLLGLGPLRRPRAFMDACRSWGIEVVATAPRESPRGERIVKEFAALFNAELTKHGGDQVPDEASLIAWLQTRAERWVESVWQRHFQWALQTGVGHGVRSTPNSAYAACVARLGWVHLPLGGSATRALLPGVRRRVAMNGLYIEGRRYDCPGLDPLRAAGPASPTGPTSPVFLRFDPHDVRQVWVRGRDATWIRAPLAEDGPMPRPRRRGGGKPVRVRDWEPATGRSVSQSPRSAPRHDQERLAYHAQLPLLQTQFLRDVLRTGDQLAVLNQSAVGGQQGVLITGPPRSGKTTALQELGRRLEELGRARHTGRLHTPVVQLRIHPADSGHTVLTRLARILNAPSSRSSRASTASTSAAVCEALLLSGAIAVLVDDALTPDSASLQASRPVDVLMHLADQVRTTFAYAGLEGKESQFTAASWPAQGRLTHLRAAPVPYGDAWERLVGDLEHALELRRHRPGSLVRLAPVLHDRTDGWAGALAHLVRSAAIEAILTGRERITEQDLDFIAV